MKKVFFHPLAAVFVTILAIIFLVSLQKTRQKAEQAVDSASNLHEQVSRLQLEVAQAEDALNQPAIDLEQEKIIRDELLMQKDGEVVFQLPPITPVEEVIETRVESMTPLAQWRQLVWE